MPVLNNVSVPNNYDGKNAILQNIFPSNGGFLSVQGFPVFVELQYAEHYKDNFGNIRTRQGTEDWTTEFELGAGAFATIPPQCIGIQFRNATAGQVATVTVAIAQGDEPALAISALGIITTVSSPLVTRQILTVVGAGTYVTPANCIAILVECIGGGGGGGGTGGTATTAGGGGVGGSYAASLISNPNATYPYVIGAGGAGSTPSGPNPGSFGVETTFGASPLIRAGGGLGGGGAAAGSAANGFSGEHINSIGDLIVLGGSSKMGSNFSASAVEGGSGGRGGGPYGGGEQAGALAGTLNSSTNGGQGLLYGGGGGGGATNGNGGTTVGGPGRSGIIVVTEYY